ncbi:MAG: LysR family transcriptional regulator [Mobilitalea sp.]
MDFKQLKTFITICELKSFTATANSLGYAQSTITTQIKLLEDELGTALFNRIGKNISLTYEGEKLLPFAKQIMQLERSIINNIYSTNEASGHLIIGTPESLCNLLVPQIIKIYKNKYPKVNIEIKLATTKKLPIMLKNNEIDLAFIIGKSHRIQELKSIFISKERMCFLASPEHPLVLSKNLSLKDIFAYPLILTSKECEYRSALMNLAVQYNLNTNIALETSNINAIKTFVKNNLGIAFLPYVSAEDSIESNQIRVLDYHDYEFDITSELIFHKDKDIFYSMQCFIDTVSEYVNNQNS